MNHGLVTAAYIVAAIFFIFSLAGLSRQESAKNGNLYGIIGMAIALVATLYSDSAGLGYIILAMVIGAAFGIHFYLIPLELKRYLATFPIFPNLILIHFALRAAYMPAFVGRFNIELIAVDFQPVVGNGLFRSVLRGKCHAAHTHRQNQT